MTIGLYFGSFNPIHKGHISIAKYIIDQKFADDVWFIVSPQNPLKESGLQANGKHRLEMAELAVKEAGLGDVIKVSDIEFSMKRPSYTIDTIVKLRHECPGFSYKLIIGADNYIHFKKWKEWERISNMVEIVVYPRPGYDTKNLTRIANTVFMENCPVYDIDATAIREKIGKNDFSDLQTYPSVIEYIKNNGLYEK